MAKLNDDQAEYDFILVLAGITEVSDEQVDALHEAGCDDATISMRSGRVFLTFSRKEESLSQAILSAIQNVRSANIGAAACRVLTDWLCDNHGYELT